MLKLIHPVCLAYMHEDTRKMKNSAMLVKLKASITNLTFHSDMDIKSENSETKCCIKSNSKDDDL